MHGNKNIEWDKFSWNNLYKCVIYIYEHTWSRGKMSPTKEMSPAGLTAVPLQVG